jgi:hypothetical protein
MEIWVTLDGAKFTISPDPATVKVGTPVIWRFLANQLAPERIRWTAYFHHGSPFRLQPIEFTTTTQLSSGQHAGATGAAVPEDPKDYKYGVRAENAQTQFKLGDEDPTLIVTL